MRSEDRQVSVALELPEIFVAAMNLIIPHGFEVNYTLGFVRGLAANGVEVCVVSSDDDERALTASGVSNVNVRGSVDPSRSRVSKIRNLLGYYGRLARLLWRRRADTVHFTGMFKNDLIVLEGLVLPPLFRLLSRRYIYTAHNAVPHGKRGKRLYEWVYRFVYAMPHFILVNTEPVKQELITLFGVASTRIVLTSIGLNEEVPATGLSAKEARCARGWDGSEKILLLFGKIHPYKGVELLVQSFDQLETAGTRLVIAGTFQDAGYRRTITGAIAAARRSSQISLEERMIPNEEVESYFKGADLLVLPYTDISQSGVLFLAMRFGVPIVATDVGAFRDFIGQETGIVTRSNDVDGLCDALHRFFDRQDAFDRQEIVAQAAKYTWPAVCARLVHLYRVSPSSRHGDRM